MLTIAMTATMPSSVRQQRRAGMPMKNSKANETPPALNNKFSNGWRSVALAGAVVDTVRVAAAPEVPATSTVEGMLQVTGSTAFIGLKVTAQVSLTVPVNPFDGVTLTVVVFPVVAPRFISMLPLLLSANVGTPAVTIASIEV